MCLGKWRVARLGRKLVDLRRKSKQAVCFRQLGKHSGGLFNFWFGEIMILEDFALFTFGNSIILD